MNMVPSPPILGALCAALLLPLLLVVLSHGPWKVVAPGRRFVLAAAAALAGWGVCTAVVGQIALPDLAAGLLILAAAVLAEFTMWTLIAWGFTASMLMALARQDQAVSFDEWVGAYTGGRTLDAFAEDRLQLLLRLGLAFRENGRVVMTPGRGVGTAGVVRLLRGAFGLNP